jgi:phosphoethanolamine N-methyltransferase
MSHTDEYTDAMLEAMDLIWGEGFMAPGGEGHVDRMVAGLDLTGKRVLDIGCGQGKPACIVAGKYGARVTGTDLEAHLVERAEALAVAEGLSGSTQFLTVEPGPLAFDDNQFDAIVISGALTQVEDKLAMYRECLRVLTPGGTLSCYDWMKPPGPFSAEMLYWFELEGLTYAMRTPEEHLALLSEAGFSDAHCDDRSAWYRKKAREEYAEMNGPLRTELVRLLGEATADHFIEDWRALTVVCDRGDLLTVYTRATKPLTHEENL